MSSCYGTERANCSGSCEWVTGACQQKCENPLIDDLNCFANPAFLKHFKNATLQKSLYGTDPKLCVDKQDLDFDINVLNNSSGSLLCDNDKIGDIAGAVSGNLSSFGMSEIISGMGGGGDTSFEMKVASIAATGDTPGLNLIKVTMALGVPITAEDITTPTNLSTNLKNALQQRPNPNDISGGAQISFENYNYIIQDENLQLLHTSVDLNDKYNLVLRGVIGTTFQDLQGGGFPGFSMPLQITYDKDFWNAYRTLWQAADATQRASQTPNSESSPGSTPPESTNNIATTINGIIHENPDPPHNKCQIGAVSFDNDKDASDDKLCISTSGDIEIEQIVQNCKTDPQSNAKFNEECCDLLNKAEIFSSGEVEDYTNCKINNFVNVNLINNIKTHPLISGAIIIVCILILLITISSIMIMKDNPLLTLLFIIILGSGIGIYIYQNPNLYDQIFDHSE